VARFNCPTCAAAYGVLRAAKVPKAAAKRVAYSKKTKRLDTNLRRAGAVRRASEYSRKLAKHMKKERDKATKKDGTFRKGQSQAKVMKAAHRCVKREMRKR
jgi:hypothetical protein